MKFSISHILFFVLLLLGACRSQKEVSPAATTEKPPPLWVSSRPNNGFKFVGIGFADKNKGGNYQMEAKKNALYDLTSEIKVDISSNSVLYTVQNNNNFNESFNSLIKLTNNENLEGYTQVDSYENEKQYWVYYQLDRQEYANQKAVKKQQTITKASNLIAASFTDENNKDFSACLKKRIQAFGVLTPYLSEEILFDPLQAGGIKTVFDLTNLIQGQLQSITVVNQNVLPELKPYQTVYAPLQYQLQLKGNSPLQNFPFFIESEDERVMVNEKSGTNGSGEIQIKVNAVEPINQYVTFALSPDIITLMGSDSIGRAGVGLLKQFIQTSALKVQANVTPIKLFIATREMNFENPAGLNFLNQAIKQKFNGREIQFTDQRQEADFVIEANAETSRDISSEVLKKNYNLELAVLSIQFQLFAKGSNNILFQTQVNDVYGYANSLQAAGLNAYANPQVNVKLAEALFFLKRKIVVY